MLQGLRAHSTGAASGKCMLWVGSAVVGRGARNRRGETTGAMSRMHCALTGGSPEAGVKWATGMQKNGGGPGRPGGDFVGCDYDLLRGAIGSARNRRAV